MLAVAARAEGDPFADIAATNFDKRGARGAGAGGVRQRPRAGGDCSAARRPAIRLELAAARRRRFISAPKRALSTPAPGWQRRRRRRSSICGGSSSTTRCAPRSTPPRARSASFDKSAGGAAEGGEGAVPIGRCRCVAADRAGIGDGEGCRDTRVLREAQAAALLKSGTGSTAARLAAVHRAGGARRSRGAQPARPRCKASRPPSRPRSARRSMTSTVGCNYGGSPKTSITASASAPCCCSPRPGLPSPSG